MGVLSIRFATKKLLGMEVRGAPARCFERDALDNQHVVSYCHFLPGAALPTLAWCSHLV